MLKMESLSVNWNPPALSSYQGPPPSPSNIRRFLKEGEEMNKEMSLEEYLYCTDGYRKSSVPIPLPLPLKLEQPEPEMDLFGDIMAPIRPKIVDILRQNSIGGDQSQMRMRMMSKPGYPGGDTKYLTLVIRISQGLQRTNTWAAARDQIIELFVKAGLPHVHIEMFDSTRVFLPSLFPLEPTDPAIQAYQLHRNSLLDCVHAELSDSWNAMCVFGLGKDSSRSKPTLVLLVQPGTVRNWQALEGRIRRVLSTCRELPIEFLPARAKNLVEDDSTYLDFHGKLLPEPDMGCSIGEVGQSGGGTLGAFVKFTTNGKTSTGILTTHHVVRPASVPPKTILKLNQHGYHTDNSLVTTVMQYPAATDLRDELAHVRRRIEKLQAEAVQRKERLNQYEYKGQEAPEHLQELYNRRRQSITDNQLRESMLGSLPFVLGKVLYSSGDIVNEKGSVLDWAYIEVPGAQKRICCRPNRLPNSDAPELKHKYAGKSFMTEGEEYDVKEKHPVYAKYFSKIEPGRWYFKRGRTTGLTTGKCHGCEVDIQRKGDIRWRNCPSGSSEVVLAEKGTREYAIMAWTNLKSSAFEEFEGVFADFFCKRGDSGSIVFDGDGFAAGLMYGELSGIDEADRDEPIYIGAGLVTSMDDILESIQAKTGGNITFL